MSGAGARLGHHGLRRPEGWAEACPERSAVVSEQRTLTYREWNRQADRLAEALAQREFHTDTAAVRTHMCVEWFVVNLALAKLGWRQVAVNWRLTPGEVRHVLSNSGASVLFLDDGDPDAARGMWSGLDVLPVPLVPTPGMECLGELISSAPEVRRRSRSRPPVVVYTSGTTGSPRGVDKLSRTAADAEAAQRAEEYLRERREQHRLREGNRTLVTLPLHHGAGEGVAQRALSAGGTVYLLDRFDPERALALIDRHRITHWTVVPTMLHRIRALPAERLASFDVSSLEVLGVGAAPVPYALKSWAMEYFGEGRLYEAYGATEVGTIAWMPPEEHRAKPHSCGRPLPCVEVRAVDAAGRTLPPGEVGELQVRTPLMIGNYLGGPGLGPDAITADGYFRVGDAGMVDVDGYVYVTGRIKDMVIVGGVNVYPAEIESVLLEHPAVLDAAVVGEPDEEMGERVVACCELLPGHTVTAQELRAALERRLARFKWPRRFEFLPELPRNAMGKVVKSELRAWLTAPGPGGDPR